MKNPMPVINKSFALALLLVSGAAAPALVRAANATVTAPAGRNYLGQKVITGTIYDEDDLKKVLFTFRRTATNTGSAIHVLREYILPGGTLAARENVVYAAGRLSSFHFEDMQNGIVGSAVLQTNSGNRAIIALDFKEGVRKKSGRERFEDHVLVNDMVVPFILEHWSELMRGVAVKCRLITLARTETVGFTFTQESKPARKGKPVVVIQMKPTSPIIAQFIETLHFVLEQEGAHHVLQYSGRTAPGIKRNGVLHGS